MLTKKLIALLTLSAILTGWIPIARAEDMDHDGEEDGFIELKEGEKAPSEGFFFDHSALSQLITKQETKLSNITIEKDTEISKLNLNIETITKKKDIEIQVNKEMYEALLKVRQDRIDQLNRERMFSDFKLVGGFLLGFASAVVLLDIAVKVIK